MKSKIVFTWRSHKCTQVETFLAKIICFSFKTVQLSYHFQYWIPNKVNVFLETYFISIESEIIHNIIIEINLFFKCCWFINYELLIICTSWKYDEIEIKIFFSHLHEIVEGLLFTSVCMCVGLSVCMCVCLSVN